MATGWAVQVSFIVGGKVMTDGQPLYFAALDEPKAAVMAIRRFVNLDPAEAEVEAVGPIPESATGALTLKSGEVLRRR
ncbi:hypothetical protein ABEG18_05750 [Alsobacter sp. KACC 23698]|uniref:DUF1488 family protein n=1 Tax=Alsobacter sp. KACC 23698 TaxID=3149229 RepID=A0AAU7JJY7_9HYPH